MAGILFETFAIAVYMKFINYSIDNYEKKYHAGYAGYHS